MQHRFLWPVLILAVLAVGAALSGGARGSAVDAHRVFSTANIRGTYGISYTVALPNSSGTTQFLSGTGLYQTDGDGHLTGEETSNNNGQICSGAVTGTYTVSRNGTGTVSAFFVASTPGCSDVSFQQSLVILDSGRIVRVANTVTNPAQVTVFEEWQRQM